MSRTQSSLQSTWVPCVWEQFSVWALKSALTWDRELKLAHLRNQWRCQRKRKVISRKASSFREGKRKRFFSCPTTIIVPEFASRAQKILFLWVQWVLGKLRPGQFSPDNYLPDNSPTRTVPPGHFPPQKIPTRTFTPGRFPPRQLCPEHFSPGKTFVS